MLLDPLAGCRLLKHPLFIYCVNYWKIVRNNYIFLRNKLPYLFPLINCYILIGKILKKFIYYASQILMNPSLGSPFNLRSIKDAFYPIKMFFLKIFLSKQRKYINNRSFLQLRLRTNTAGINRWELLFRKQGDEEKKSE